jgi:hypothetical protein
VKSRGQIWQEVHVIIVKGIELDKFNEKKKERMEEIKEIGVQEVSAEIKAKEKREVKEA